MKKGNTSKGAWPTIQGWFSKLSKSKYFRSVITATQGADFYKKLSLTVFTIHFSLYPQSVLCFSIPALSLVLE